MLIVTLPYCVFTRGGHLGNTSELILWVKYIYVLKLLMRCEGPKQFNNLTNVCSSPAAGLSLCRGLHEIYGYLDTFNKKERLQINTLARARVLGERGTFLGHKIWRAPENLVIMTNNIIMFY